MSPYSQDKEEEEKILSLSKISFLRLKAAKALTVCTLLYGSMTVNYLPLEQWVACNLRIIFKLCSGLLLSSLVSPWLLMIIIIQSKIIWLDGEN